MESQLTPVEEWIKANIDRQNAILQNQVKALRKENVRLLKLIELRHNTINKIDEFLVKNDHMQFNTLEEYFHNRNSVFNALKGIITGV